MSNSKHSHRFSVDYRGLMRAKPSVPKSSSYQREISEEEIIERVRSYNPNMKKYVKD